MSPQIIWIFFIGLTVIGSAGYNVAVKLAGQQINVFAFTVVLTAFAFVGHLTALLIYKFVISNPEKIIISPYAVLLAFIAGMSVVMIDLGYFLAVKSGGMALSQAVWTIGGLLLVTMIGIYFFKEGFDLYKAMGLVFGIISLALLMKKN